MKTRYRGQAPPSDAMGPAEGRREARAGGLSEAGISLMVDVANMVRVERMTGSLRDSRAIWVLASER